MAVLGDDPRRQSENQAIVFTMPRLADPDAGTRPAPELARHDRIDGGAGRRARTRSRTRRLSRIRASRSPSCWTSSSATTREVSATEYQRRELTTADHLAVLNAIWQGETAGLQRDRYRDLAASLLPAGHDASELDTSAGRLAVADAAGSRGGRAGRRRCPAAGDQRPQPRRRPGPGQRDRRPDPARRTATMIPAAARTWAEQVPQCGGERQRYLEQIAAAMDERKDRLGEFAAETSPAVGGCSARPTCRPIRWTGWNGSSGPARSAPTASCTAGITRPSRAGRSRTATARRSAPPGMPPTAR